MRQEAAHPHLRCSCVGALRALWRVLQNQGCLSAIDVYMHRPIEAWTQECASHMWFFCTNAVL